MEQYEYFCTISRHLYYELELAATMAYTLSSKGLDAEYYEQRKKYLLHNIEEHLKDFEQIIFEHETIV